MATKLPRTRRRAAKHRPTAKQRKFLAGLAKGQSVMEAAKGAGYSRATQKSDVYQLMRTSSPLRAAVTRALEKAGIEDALLFKKLRQGLDATERKSLMRTKDVRLVDRNGQEVVKVVNVHEVEDLVAWDARLDYATAALRLKGLLGHEAPEEPDPEPQRRVKVVLNLGCPQCVHCTGPRPPTVIGAGTTAP